MEHRSHGTLFSDWDTYGGSFGAKGDARVSEEGALDGRSSLEWERVTDASEEVLLLWSLRDPFTAPMNRFSAQSEQELRVEVQGQELCIQQSPSCLRLVGVTGSVLWDSAFVLAKMLEHHSDSPSPPFSLSASRCLELGSGCGLAGCTALLLGAAAVTVSDQFDRLRLLAGNIAANMPPHTTLHPDRFGRHHTPMQSQRGPAAGTKSSSSISSGSGRSRSKGCCNQGHRAGRLSGEEANGGDRGNRGMGEAAACRRDTLGSRSHTERSSKGSQAWERHSLKSTSGGGGGLWRGSGGASVRVEELLWGRMSASEVEAVGGPFDFVLASDVVYCEEAVQPLLDTLASVSSPNTLTLLAGELRNDAVIEFFLERALESGFRIFRATEAALHPQYQSRRVVLYALLTFDSQHPEQMLCRGHPPA